MIAGESTPVTSRSILLVMTDKDDSASPEAHAAWSTEDRRLMVITFVGTVIANIVTVLIIGLAVVAAKYIRSGDGLALLVGLFTGMASSVIIVTALNRLGRRFPKLRDPEALSGKALVRRVFAVIFLTTFIIALLVVIGIAAGIK